MANRKRKRKAAPKPEAPAPTPEVAALGIKPHCLTIQQATRVVLDACGDPNANVSKQLKEFGIIDPTSRKIFVDKIVTAVGVLRCKITAGDVPNDSNDTLEKVRDAVFENAG